MPNELPRPEYPRPDRMRADWLCLNGRWGFAFDDGDEGLPGRWFEHLERLEREIVVPFAYQSRLSGIGTPESHPVVWYARRFTVPDEWAGRRVRLHFGAVDYRSQVWVNGIPAASSAGGYVPFSADITPLLAAGGNTLVVRVEDRDDPAQPRGKQSVAPRPRGCWYSRVTGIWQSVWLEPLADLHTAGLWLLPDIEREMVRVGVTPSLLRAGVKVRATVSLSSTYVAGAEAEISLPAAPVRQKGPHPGILWLEVPVRRPLLWSPEEPDLYQVAVEMEEAGAVVDRVESAFGMRQVSTAGGRFCLNGRPYRLKLALDQGYWPDGLYTAPSDRHLRRDVELARALGFNGVRKHQKIEDPRFYYWADRLGLLVWAEMPSAFAATPEAMAAVADEWQRAVLRDRNHPSIVAWVPMNESWGATWGEHTSLLRENSREVEGVRALYHLTKALDDTRPVVDNDGYDHAETDIVTLHDYSREPAELAGRATAIFQGEAPDAARHLTLLPGFPYAGQPIVVSEYGGIGLAPAGRTDAWGYGEARDADDLAGRFEALTQALLADDRIAGYCYTQLTDVEQETNGLLTAEREPKVPPERIREAQRGA